MNNIDAVRRLNLVYDIFGNMFRPVGRLTSLTKLEINECSNLESIPNTIGNLTSLTRLDITECFCLDFLPNSIGKTSNGTPIAIGSADSHLISSSTLSRKQVAKSPCSMMIKTRVPIKSFPKTSSQSFTSFVAGRWESVAPKPENAMKAIRIKISPNKNQKKILMEWINTSDYVYNKTVEALQGGAKNSFQDLRDKLVTVSTKKTNPDYLKLSLEIKAMHTERARLKKLPQSDDTKAAFQDLGMRVAVKNKALREAAKKMNASKNEGVFEWETETPNHVRAGRV
jgi:hypothetical protein